LIDGAFPKRLMTRNPSARLLKGFPAQPEVMNAAFYIAFHYPGLFQHFQVFGDGGLGGAKLAAEFTGTADLAARKRANHRTPGAVGQSVKGEIEFRAGMHSQMTIY
jgi:hypothetical protein